MEPLPRFINEEISDIQDKANYQAAILVDLRSNEVDADVRNIARLHMKTEDRDRYVSFLRENGLPETTVRKNISLIEPQIKTARWEFNSGIKVSGSPDAFSQHISFDVKPDGQTTMRIDDMTKRVR